MLRPWASQRTELDGAEKIGPYRLESLLGEGGMGIVFRAVRETDQTTVALKVLRKELSSDDTYRKRFIHEARAARSVESKHLAPILDAGEIDGYHYLAVGYVQGHSLSHEIERRGPLPLDRVPRLVAQVASGLDSIHAAGLVHRDVKPSNIMLDEDGSAVLTDFGLAKGRGYTVLTKPGQVMGTVDYLAPELIKGAPASPASDIYGLGCTVFECIAGDPPFADRPQYQAAVAHLEDEPSDPFLGRVDGTPSLSWALLQALAKDPAQRPRTATAYAYGIRVAAASAQR
jgi:serine/threonine protein kinase